MLIARGRLSGRLVVASYSYLAAVVVLIPAFLVPSLSVALPLFVVAGAALAAPIPPLDARLGVIHPQLWGRAEAVRTLLLIVAAFLITLSPLVASALILQLARRFYPRELAAAAASR